MTDSRDSLGGTFDSAAELYEAARPTYPAALFDDLFGLTGLQEGDRALEIGCGTGKATRAVLERGVSVVCVEPGARLADVARRNLAGKSVEVHVAPFETWKSEPDRFDLIYAATAWRWVDPEIRYQKSHSLLRRGGHLAFWSAHHAFPSGFDPFFTEIQDVYAAIGESDRGEWPPPPPEDVPDGSAEIAASGLFEDVKVRRYLWEAMYTADEYIALLATFSGHIAMESTKREKLYEEIRDRLARRDDRRVCRHWAAILHVARRAEKKPFRRGMWSGIQPGSPGDSPRQAIR
jgi:SAM-dependent methyltransferase